MRNKSAILFSIILVSALVFSPLIKAAYSQSPPRAIPPIVTTDWLEGNLTLPNLVVLDIRSPDSYAAGHIPGAINVPEGMWYINPPFGPDLPWMQVPPTDYLLELIGNASITSDSFLVVVGTTSGLLLPQAPLALYSTATITRVAITLLYAGVRNVAILDGGYDKWAGEGKPTSDVPVTPTPVTYTGVVKNEMFVSRQYVAGKIGESIIVDARDAEVYLGFIQEPWAAKLGHIPTARNLPTPWLWDLNVNATTGEAIYTTYKNVEMLETLAYHIIGTNMSKEIIVYCGVGGYASTMYFVLSEVLGYENAKIYDGSAQEWTSDPQLPVVYEELGSQYIELSSNYTELQSNYTGLLNNYEELESDYDDLSSEHAELQSSYDELARTTTPAYLTYTFVATTIILGLIAVYLAFKWRAKKS
jgi:thiosulfate/3-mercaptopyruvate sulfurtransferase